MKKSLLILFALMNMFGLSSLAAKKINLTEAADKNLISCSIVHLSASPDSLLRKGGHPLELSLNNLSGESLELVVASGQRFRSLDSTRQNLMILENQLITLKPGEKKKAAVIGVCINKSKSSPGKNKYRIGKLASGVLLKVANFLGKNRIYGGTAQQAVWTITDNTSIENVKGNTNIQTRMVRSFLYETTGRVRPPRETDPLSYPNVALNGNVGWTMPADQKVTLAVLDPEGRVVGYLFRDYSFKKGNQTYQFEFMDVALLPGINYKIQVISGTTVLSEYAVKSREEKGG